MINWDHYFINIACEVAKKSKDPSSQVGCVIVTEDNRPISFGYNGFVSGCDEQYMTTERPMKYLLTIHAEMNALIFAEKSVVGSKAYVTHGPCDNCLKHLMQAGIKKIIYKDPGILKQRGTVEQKDAIKRLLKSKPIICRNIDGKDYIEDID
ncbi:MAG: deoxycytidylate deaminase [Bacteriovoracia bacterium]